METGELIQRKDEEEAPVLSVDFEYIPKKVFNFEVADWHTYFVGIFAWVVHNAGRCLSELINWSWKSGKTFGHAFLKHGQANLKKLKEIARIKKVPQGIWTDNSLAADFIKKNWDNLKVGENVLDLPPGLGQIIKPDGTLIDATKVIIVKNSDGTTNLLKTAYPK